MEPSAPKKRVSRVTKPAVVSTPLPKKQKSSSNSKNSTKRAASKSTTSSSMSEKQTAPGKRQTIRIKSKHNRAHASLKIANRSTTKKKDKEPSFEQSGSPLSEVSHVSQITFFREQLRTYAIPHLPVPSTLVIVRVTRVFGMLFFLAGALSMYGLTQHHMRAPSNAMMLGQISTPMLSQSIQESRSQIDVTISDADPVRTIEQNQNNQQSNQQTSGAVRTTDSPSDVSVPEPRITVEDRVESSEEMLITVTVPEATKVTLLTYVKKDQKVVSLGDAMRLDDTTWRYIWDTRDFPESDYKFKLSVHNSKTQYQFTDSKKYTIQRNDVDQKEVQTHKSPNENKVEDQSSALNTALLQDTDTKYDETTSPEDELTSPTLFAFKPLDNSTLEGEQIISVNGPDSDAVVRLNAYNDATSNLYYLDKPYYSGVNEWSVSWDTALVPNGSYTLEGDVKDNDIRRTFSPISVRINNPKSVTPVNVGTDATTTLNVPASVLKPEVLTRLDGDRKLDGFRQIFFEAPDANSIEVYALPKNSLTPLFLGRAFYEQNTRWKFVWNTKETPNGEYTLYPKIKNQYGFFEGEKVSVKVLNTHTPQLSETQSRDLDTLHTAIEEMQPIFARPQTSVSSTPTSVDDRVPPPDEFTQTLALEKDREPELRNFVTEYNSSLKNKLMLLSQATRQGDDATYNAVLQDIEKIKNEFLERISDQETYRDVTDATQEYITKLTDRSIETTARNEKILKERVGESVTRDSDSDGVSDYDELHLYQTNPFAADSDGDGFLDNTEIVQGFDPLSIEREALIVYESPKDSGIVRDDILAVSSIATLDVSDEEKTELGKDSPQAVISGKGLPNSFVTLYIFSEPIVVTVKTDSSGNWNYIFDKELEDGSHEVYVGITDNTGRVIAKSEPLAFVKTAEAFTGEEASNTLNAPSDAVTNLWSDDTLLLVGSGVVLGIGLILMLLGFYVGVRKQPALIAAT